MLDSNILCLNYLINGLIVSCLYTSFKYGKTINNKNNEGTMVNVFMMAIVVLWPLFLIKYIFSLIKYVRYKQNHKSKL